MKTAKDIIKEFYNFTEGDFAEDAEHNLNAFDAINMIDEALKQVNNLRKPDVSGLLGEWEKGYKEGWEAATTNAIAERRKNYSPNCH